MNCTYDLKPSGRIQREMNCTLTLEDFLLYKGPGFNITYAEEESGPSLGVVSPAAYNGLEVFFGNTKLEPGFRLTDEDPLNFCISTPMTKITTPPGKFIDFFASIRVETLWRMRNRIGMSPISRASREQ